MAAIDATASLQNLTKISRPRHPGMTGRVGFEQIRLRVYQPYILWHKARTALPLPDSGRFHLQNADWGVAQSPQVRGVPAPPRACRPNPQDDVGCPYSPLRVSVDGFWYFVPHRLHAQQRTLSGLDLRHLLHSAGGSAGTRLIARLLRGDTVGQAKIVSELR